MLLSREEKKEARSKTDKGIQDTGHQEPQNFYNTIHFFFKPQNKLEMKTQKKADATYKSTKNIQRARSGDNLSSTTGTEERAAPQTTW